MQNRHAIKLSRNIQTCTKTADDLTKNIYTTKGQKVPRSIPHGDIDKGDLPGKEDFARRKIYQFNCEHCHILWVERWPSYCFLDFFEDNLFSSFFCAAANSSSVGSDSEVPCPPNFSTKELNIESNRSFLSVRR